MGPLNKILQISLRTILEAVAIIAFILALAYQRVENKNGRYQTTVHNGAVYVTDTMTGQIWIPGGSGWNKLQPLPKP